MTLRDSIKNMNLWMYISRGGIDSLFPDGQFEYSRIEKESDEAWVTKHGAIFTIFSYYWQIDFHFNETRNYMGNSLKFFIMDVFPMNEKFIDIVVANTEINFLNCLKVELQRQNLFEGTKVYIRDEEVVVFLPNGVNMHFMKISDMNGFLIQTITPPSMVGGTTRELVESKYSLVPNWPD